MGLPHRTAEKGSVRRGERRSGQGGGIGFVRVVDLARQKGLWATGERFCDPPLEAWHCCRDYHGPPISRDVWAWLRRAKKRPARQAGGDLTASPHHAGRPGGNRPATRNFSANIPRVKADLAQRVLPNVRAKTTPAESVECKTRKPRCAGNDAAMSESGFALEVVEYLPARDGAGMTATPVQTAGRHGGNMGGPPGSSTDAPAQAASGGIMARKRSDLPAVDQKKHLLISRSVTKPSEMPTAAVGRGPPGKSRLEPFDLRCV